MNDQDNSQDQNHLDSSGQSFSADSANQKLLLDDDGIPILNDVVYQNEEDEFADLYSEEDILEQTLPSLNRLNLNLPNHNALVHAIREQIRSRLLQEITPVVQKASKEIAEEMAAEYEELFNQRLNRILQERIETLIDESLSKELHQ